MRGGMSCEVYKDDFGGLTRIAAELANDTNK